MLKSTACYCRKRKLLSQNEKNHIFQDIAYKPSMTLFWKKNIFDFQITVTFVFPAKITPACAQAKHISF